jgi:hypothetical protein
MKGPERNRVVICVYISLLQYIFSRVGMIYKTGFGLDDWISCTLYIHTVPDYRQYRAIFDLHTSQFTVAHALGFSVFTSRILATDLSQSHYHFKSHMKYFLRRLIHFLPLFCNCQFRELYSVQFQAHIPAEERLETKLSTLDYCSVLYLAASSDCVFYNTSARTTQKTQPLLLRRRVY